ncbi:MAG: hypothetical protein GX040_10070 [Alcaligenaceae bacterium]|nr:hypothetical protein [Alcaligenaceae bacterium]
MPDWRPEAKFSTWLTQIARNTTIDAIFSEPTNRTAIETERDAIGQPWHNTRRQLIVRLFRTGKNAWRPPQAPKKRSTNR